MSCLVTCSSNIGYHDIESLKLEKTHDLPTDMGYYVRKGLMSSPGCQCNAEEFSLGDSNGAMWFFNKSKGEVVGASNEVHQYVVGMQKSSYSIAPENETPYLVTSDFMGLCALWKVEKDKKEIVGGLNLGGPPINTVEFIEAKSGKFSKIFATARSISDVLLLDFEKREIFDRIEGYTGNVLTTNFKEELLCCGSYGESVVLDFKNKKKVSKMKYEGMTVSICNSDQNSKIVIIAAGNNVLCHDLRKIESPVWNIECEEKMKRMLCRGDSVFFSTSVLNKANVEDGKVTTKGESVKEESFSQFFYFESSQK